MTGFFEKGIFVISVDVEMAWGAIAFNRIRENMPAFARTRMTIRRLLELLDKYRLKATWPVVGHLFQGQCEPVDWVRHPEIPRPAYNWFEGDWFYYDPCTDSSTDPFWYAPDVIGEIRGAATEQEIASHSYCHFPPGDPCYTSDTFLAELNACVSQAHLAGLQLNSYAFPQNDAVYLEMLRCQGFKCFRGAPDYGQAAIPVPLKAARDVLEGIKPVYRNYGMPKFEPEGIWNIPVTEQFFLHSGPGHKLPPKVRVHHAIQGLRNAAKEYAMFHLWLNATDIAVEPDLMLGGIEAILSQADELRNAGSLASMTMGGLASYLEAIPVGDPG
jgi:hypothetical protein